MTKTSKNQTFIIQVIKYLPIAPIALALLFGNTAQASDNINLPTPNDSIKKRQTISVYNVQVVDVMELIESPSRDNNISQEPKDKPFVTVEQMPEYVGGRKALNAYIDANLRYPVVAQENGIQGRVTVRFVVNKDGTITHVQMIRGIDPECNKEAIRLVKAMPKWRPGKQNNEVVNVYYTLPILFRLPE